MNRPLPALSVSFGRQLLRTIGALLAIGAALHAQAQTALADQPPLSTYAVPGNLALALSVEFPTAVSVAHTNRTYGASNEYLGYFDPNKCYSYTSDNRDTPASQNVQVLSYFSPSGAASGHLCSGQWSGNFLNWVSMQTIDTFRWVMTGGYRVRDDPDLTVIEKAWASGQGGACAVGGNCNFPDSSLAPADIAGATPFGSQAAFGFTARISGQGNWMRFSVAQRVTYDATYWNNKTRSGAPAAHITNQVGTSAIQGGVSPAPNVSKDIFSAEFIGQVTAPAKGTYVFQLKSDDGSTLYINNTAVASADYYSGAVNTAALQFEAGDKINIKIDYVQGGGGAVLQLSWTTPLNGAFTEVGGGADVAGNTTQAYLNAAVAPSTLYDVFMRAKVCDGSSGAGGLEANCKGYGANSKPEGLLQKYNKQLRFSAFGYLNDGSIGRDAGVLRARQKFVGPSQPVYASPDIVNAAAEWEASTGVFVRNPDGVDAQNSNVLDSGVLNYVNKFGEITHQGYKAFDPVSELYYATLRYYRNLGNVPEWSDISTLSASDKARLLDGFPAITEWKDPMLYDCQRNFVLGIGDVHTHNDKNVPGNTNSYREPTMPKAITPGDTTSNAVTATQQVGTMEGFTTTSSPFTLSAMLGNLWGSCCDGNSALIAGLAYDAHTSDIRPDLKNKTRITTVDTYWVDVQEGQRYEKNNQFYLATKYGGFTVPTGFKPYDAAATLTDASWWNGSDYNVTSDAQPVQQKRPNNYYSGGRPDLMQSGLTAAFAAIAGAAGQISSSSFLTPLPQIGDVGTPSFSASYDASNWSGTLVGSFTKLSASGAPTATAGGEFGQVLTAQSPTSRSIATWSVSTSSSVASRGVQFEATAATGAGATSLNTDQLAALNTSYVAGDDSADYVQYLRGDRSKERLATATAADAARPYRTRASLLGDIVNSKPTVVGPPSFPFSDSSNPGYNAFKTGSARANRPTVVYVGANDGMLHAVSGNLATPTSNDPGLELFAYVPNAMFKGPNGTANVDGLASLGNPTFVHHYMVDATASNFDVDFNRTSDGTAAPPTSWTPDWRTVLIGGLGKGGKAFYALDVTDPASMTNEVTLASKVLWEFTQPNYLGYTYGEPAVMKTKKYGWVVVLPSGYNNTDGVGHLMFLNPKTGKLLDTVTMPAGSGGLAHVNSYIVDGTDGTADALYAGDLQGNLWRVDVTGAFGSATPKPLLLAQFTDGSASKAAQPVTTRPQIAVDPTSGRRFVLTGTGRLLDSTDIGSPVPAGQTQSFYAIVDGTNAAFNATAPSGVTYPVTRAQLQDNTQSVTTDNSPAALTAAGWFIDLATPSAGPAARMLIDSTTSSGNVGFATTIPNGDACSPGGSGLNYAINFGTARSILLDASGNLTGSLASTTPVTETKFVSNNGNLTFLYGTAGTAKQAKIQPNGGYKARRINWREVPIAD